MKCPPQAFRAAKTPPQAFFNGREEWENRHQNDSEYTCFSGVHCNAFSQPYLHCRADRLVAALDHALLVVAGGLIVGVDDGVGGHAVGVVGLGPGVDGVDVGVGVEEEGEHFCKRTHNNRSQHTNNPKSTKRSPVCSDSLAPGMQSEA